MMSTKTWQKVFSVFLLAGMLLSLAQPRAASARPQPVPSNAPQAQNAPEPDEKALAKIEPQVLDGINSAGSSDFIVRFSEQADLSAAYDMAWKERGEFVYSTLKETAARSQAKAIENLKTQGLEYQSFIAGNDLYVKAGNLDAALELASLEEVDSIRAPRIYQVDPVEVKNPALDFTWVGELVASNAKQTVIDPALAMPQAITDWGITDTNADDFWADYGFEGDGIVVANIDTGVDYTHPALLPNYKCQGGNHADCWFDPGTANCSGPGGGPCDTIYAGIYHGSHTMGTMVAENDPSLTYIAGMAPDAQWIACLGCPSGSCPDFDLETCADWMLAPNGSSDNRPNIVNNSWGGGGGDNWYLAKVAAWRAAGIFPAFSAGNSGSSCSTLGSPGDYQESFGSAAHDVNRNIASFSSRGPSAVFGHDPYTKPNISAPGVAIWSTQPGNSWTAIGGTSMASPHSAGAVALLWSCNPSLVGQIDQTFEILQDNTDAPPAGTCGAPPDGEGNYTFGYGYLNVLAAGVTQCGDSTLSGYVTEGVTEAPGDPLVGAIVETTNGVETRSATTGAGGFYSIMLFGGTYTVTAWAYGYEEAVIPGVVIAGPTTLNITPDVAADYIISGTVVDSVTTDPLWATIEVDGTPIDPPVTVYQTDPATGFYSMTLAGGQSYALTASALLHTLEVRDIGEPTGDQTQNFALVATTTDGGIAGFVRNYYTGDPIEDATVVVNTAGNPSDTTDATGYFEILGLTPGIYEATASADFYSPETLTGIVVLQSNVAFVEFELPTSHLVYAPETLEKTLVWGMSDTDSPGLVISNTGIGDLTFELVEQAGGFIPNGTNAGEDILVVRYDTTAADAMQAALTANGYTYLGVTSTAFQAMPLADLLTYKAIFHAGVAYPASQPLLMAYLDAGGSLYISDNDLGWSQGSTAFYQTYLQATYGDDDGGDLLTGDGIMAGLNPDITADPYPDTFTIGPDGVQIFHFTVSGASAGVFVERMGYKAIYTSFDFEYITAVADETELVARVLENIVGVPSTPFPWLTETPITGTVGAGLSADIELFWDASVPEVDQPGVYTATLAIVNNDPVAQDASIPVTLNVLPAVTMGMLEGTVSTLGHCFSNPAPLEAATVVLEGSMGYTFTLETDANGDYQRWLDSSENPYAVTVTIDGYETGTAIVNVTGGVTTTQDFVLTWLEPCVSVDPAALSVSLELGLITNTSMTIANDGGVALDFELQEKTGEYLPLAGEDVLVVRSDTTAADAMQAALTANGFTYLGVTTSEFNGMSVADLLAFRAVFWAGPASTTYHPLLMAYLDAGGSLYISDNDLGYSNNATVFYQTYLQATYISDDPGINTLIGEGIMAGLNPDITSDPYPDDFTVGAEGVRIFQFTGGNAAGIVINRMGYAAIYTSFDFDDIASVADETELINRVMATIAVSDVTWLSEDPITGTVPVAGDQLVDVTFDATVPEVPAPGTYTAEIVVRSNDPINGRLSVPVEMVVTAPEDWGELEGIVNTTGHCDNNLALLEGATVFIEGGDGYTFTTQTDAMGYYHFWVDSDHNPLTVTVSADEHIGDSAVVDIVAGDVVDQPFDLRWLKPCVSAAPDALEATVEMGDSITVTLTLENAGAVATDFTIKEQDGGYNPNKVSAGESVPFISVKSTDKTDANPQYVAGQPVDIKGTESWGNGTVMPGVGRYRAGSACNEDCTQVWVFGGGTSVYSADVMYYDATTDTWTTGLAPIPNPAQNWQAVFIDGLFYLAGGYNGAHNNWLQIYDPATDSWSAGANMAAALTPMAAGWDGKLYVFGGNPGPTNAVSMYDPAIDTWTYGLAPMPTANSYGRAITVGDYIYVVGGATPSATFDRYDPATDTWTVGPTMPTARGDASLFAVGDYLYVSGGIESYTTWAGITDIERYDLTGFPTGAWEIMPVAPEGFGAAAYGCAADKMWSIGGQDASATASTTNRYQDEGLPCNCGVIADVPWLSEDPIIGTLDADTGEVIVDVTMDASVVPQPGVYYAFLKVKTDDPVMGTLNVPVTMTVSPTADYGLLLGTVTSQGYCDAASAPIEGAEILIEASDTTTYTIMTDANGEYSRWLPVSGNNYIVSVTAVDHEFGIVSDVVIVGQGQTQVDFDLRLLQPCVSAVPAALEVDVPLGYEETLALDITNNGAVSADFELFEVEGTPLNPRVAAEYNVLIITPDVTGGGDISLLLNTLALFPDLIVTVWDTTAGNPTAADMAPYDVVLFGNDILWDSGGLDKVAVGNAIADYIDADGKVLEAEFAQSYDDWGFAGRYMTDGYSPFTPASLDLWGSDTMVIEEPDHPVMAGVTSITDNFNQQDPGLATDAVLLASWSTSGYNAVAVTDNVVALNMNVFHSADWTGDLGQLLYNAISWLAGGVEAVDVPWLAEDPITGTVSHDSSFPVDVTFTAFPTMTVGGVYTASLILNNDDPQNPEIAVPVTMNVVAPVYGVEVSADQVGSGEPGDVLTYTVTVTNTSNFATDSFTVTLGTYVYTTTLSTGVVGPLAMGESATFVVTVLIPEGALDGEHDTVQITVTSVGDPTKTAIVNVTTNVYVVIIPPTNFPVYLPLIWKVYP
jgi:hypothetical protein